MAGLTGIRYGISAIMGREDHWQYAVLCVLIAGVLDGLDGRIARLLRGESRFGAELTRCRIRSPLAWRRR